MTPLGPMPASAASRTVDTLLVHAPLRTIFTLAADVERWPDHLAHYRYVRRRTIAPHGEVVAMSANQPFGFVEWPTSWTSLMEVREHPPSIRFRHVGGVTTHMEVEWRFEARGADTWVTIEHLWDGPAWPVVGVFAARVVIGPVFVHGIASRTLAGLARVAEGSETSP